MLRVIHKVWVGKFYEQNAGLLLFVFFVMFGLVDSNNLWQYHLGLVLGTLQSYPLMGIVVLVWAFYAFRSYYFLVMALRKPENAFLLELAKLKPLPRLLRIGYAQLLNHLPVYVYALFMAVIAIYENLWPGLLLVMVGLTALFVMTCFGINRLITSVHVPRLQVSIPWPQWKLPVPFVWYYLGWIKHQHTLAWFLTKLFSGLAIVLFLQIETGQYDHRPAALGLWLALTGHAVLIAELRKLEERYLIFLNALPLSTTFRFVQLWLTYAVLLIPEMIVLAFNHLAMLDWFGLSALATTTLLFWHVHLYAPRWTMDKHLRRIIMTYLAGFMVILTGYYGVALPLLLISTVILFQQDAHKHDSIAV